jgi:hypothetical protein
LRATRSRERAPDDWLREAIHPAGERKEWIASSQVLLAMTMWRRRAPLQRSASHDLPDDLRVIASAAKQSIFPMKERSELLRRVAPRNDGDGEAVRCVTAM